MTIKQILIAARKLINKPQRWTRRVLRRDGRGKAVDAHMPGAARHCAIGAIMGASPSGSTGAARCFKRFLNSGESLTDFNDTHTHREVLALFTKAIRSLKNK